jgi:putative transposase
MEKKSLGTPRRAIEDEVLTRQIERLYNDNFKVYGARKVHRQMNHEGIPIGRCRVQRLMRQAGIHGARQAEVSSARSGRCAEMRCSSS